MSAVQKDWQASKLLLKYGVTVSSCQHRFPIDHPPATVYASCGPVSAFGECQVKTTWQRSY